MKCIITTVTTTSLSLGPLERFRNIADFSNTQPWMMKISRSRKMKRDFILLTIFSPNSPRFSPFCSSISISSHGSDFLLCCSYHTVFLERISHVENCEQTQTIFHKLPTKDRLAKQIWLPSTSALANAGQCVTSPPHTFHFPDSYRHFRDFGGLFSLWIWLYRELWELRTLKQSWNLREFTGIFTLVVPCWNK